MSKVSEGKRGVDFGDLDARNLKRLERILPLLLSTPQRQNDMNERNDAGDIHDCSCFSLHRSRRPGSHFRLALRVPGIPRQKSVGC